MPGFPKASRHAESLSAAVFSDLARRAREMEGPVYPLHVGDTYRLPLPQARAEAQQTDRLQALHNYAPVQGLPELLTALQARIAAVGGRPIAPSCVQVVAGATSGLSIAAQALLEPGDEVLLPAPYWPLIRGIIAGRGAIPVEVPFFDRLGQRDFDPARALEAKITDRTVAVYVNSPHNPTGAVLDADHLAVIARIAKQHGLWIICDEAYEDLCFTDPSPPPAWSRDDFQGRTLACHTFSKGYGLAGARVGYVHGPEPIMTAIRGIQTFATYCAPKPMQWCALRALEEGAEWVAEAKAAYASAATTLCTALGVPPVAAGTFTFVDASPHMRAGETLLGFLERCLERGVLLTPGTACGADYDTWVRACFTSVGPTELADAAERLRPVFSGNATPGARASDDSGGAG